MDDMIERQQSRAAAIEEAAGHLLESDCEVTRSLAGKVSELASLIGEDLQLALDAS